MRDDDQVAGVRFAAFALGTAQVSGERKPRAETQNLNTPMKLHQDGTVSFSIKQAEGLRLR